MTYLAGFPSLAVERLMRKVAGLITPTRFHWGSKLYVPAGTLLFVFAFLGQPLHRDHAFVLGGIEHDHALCRATGDANT